MYTNAGILAMHSSKAVAGMLLECQVALGNVERGEVEISARQFDTLVRWEQDMKRYFIEQAEKLGVTNVSSNALSLF